MHGHNVNNIVMREIRMRKSVRAFEGAPITPATRARLVEAALQAPTAGNQTLYAIIDIKDPEKKARLATLCDNQPFIATAQLVLVFIADCHRWQELYRAAGINARPPGPGDALLAMADALIAAQNVVVAAESFGLGSCYIGDILEHCEEIRQLLSLPGETFPAAMLVIGYPTAQQRERKKPRRFAPETIVHENAYRPLEKAALRAMYADHVGIPVEDIDGSVQAFCNRKYLSDFAREMNRSATVYLEAFLQSGWDAGERE